MSKPNDIPQGVWDKAIATHDVAPDHGMQMRHHRIEAIARALIAEREACAMIADNGRYTTFMHWDPEGREPVTVAIPYREEIAVAIRHRE